MLLEVFYIPFFRHRVPLPFVFLQIFSQISAYHASVVNEMATVISQAGFEVLPAVTMRSTIVWNLTICLPTENHWRFGGIY